MPLIVRVLDIVVHAYALGGVTLFVRRADGILSAMLQLARVVHTMTGLALVVTAGYCGMIDASV